MTALAACLAAVCVALLVWAMHGWVARTLVRYRQAFTSEASMRLGELFLFIDPGRLWALNVLLCVSTALAVYAWSAHPALAAASALAALRLPRFWTARLRRARLARFDAQLPDMLLTLASGLKAGASVPVVLRSLVEQAEPPLSQEFGLMLREQRIGVPLEQALVNLHGRVPSDATALVVAALRVASLTGGNLSETLERIAATLRATLHLQGRIGALTAQGRMQAWVMGALPPLLLFGLDRLEPQTMAVLWHTPAGWCVLALVGTLEVLGMILIRRIVDIEV